MTWFTRWIGAHLPGMPDPNDAPNPSPPPDTFDAEFAGTGLTAMDGTKTLMQVIEENPHSLNAHAVAALFNCYTIGREKFGYDPEELKRYIRESDPTQLLATLQRLNSR